MKRLQEEIDLLKPRLVVAIGKTPLWALTGRDLISKSAGMVLPIDGIIKSESKCFSIYHPAYILRNRPLFESWKLDLTKLVNNNGV